MKFPTPLENRYWWNPGTWYLPSASLSIASFSSFLMAFIIIMLSPTDTGDLKKIFALPLHILPNSISNQSKMIILALLTFLMSLFILWRTSPRPSRLFIKLWVVILILLNIATLVIIVFFNTSPDNLQTSNECQACWKWSAFQHTALLASILSTAVLSLRLLKPRLDSSIIQYVTPLTLLLVVPIVIFSVWGLINYASEKQQAFIDKASQQFKKEAIIVQDLFTTNPNKPNKPLPIELLQERTELLRTLLERPSISSENMKIALADAKNYPTLDEKEVERNAQLIFKNINQLKSALNFPPAKSRVYTFTEGKWMRDKTVHLFNNALTQYYHALNAYIVKIENEIKNSNLDNKQKLANEFDMTIESLEKELSQKFHNWKDYWITYQLPVIFGKYDQQDFLKTLVNIPIFDDNVTLYNIDSLLSGKGLTKLSRAIDGNYISRSCINSSKTFRCLAYNANSEAVDIAVEFRARRHKKMIHAAIIVPQSNSDITLNANKIESALDCNKLSVENPAKASQKEASLDNYGDNVVVKRIRLEKRIFNKCR